METQYIKEVISSYLSSEDINYAILINGKWGSGKTHFWKNQLKPIAEAKKLNVIYISLYGFDKVSSIEQALFIKLFPFLNKDEGTFSKIIKVSQNAINAIGKHVFKASLDEILKGITLDNLDLKKNVVCFDDLERSRIPIKEVLGYINNYVEHRSLKTIILADENEILLKEEYNSIKEKTVGRVLNYTPKLKDILPSLFIRYQNNEEYYKLLTNYKDLIVEMMECFKCFNLRIISFFFEIFQNISKFLTQLPEYHLKELLFFSAAVSVEFKEGELESNDVNNPKGLENMWGISSIDLIRERFRSGKSGEEMPKPYKQLFHERYTACNIAPYHFYQSVYAYILTGYLNEDILIKELADRFPKNIPDEIRVFREITESDIRRLENDQFTRSRDNLIIFAKEGKYYPFDYLQICATLFSFSRNGLIDMSIDEIKNALLTGIVISSEKAEYNENLESKIRHFEALDPETLEIKNAVYSIYSNLLFQSQKKEADIIIEYLAANNIDKLNTIFEESQLNNDVIRIFDISRLASVLAKNTSNTMIQLFSSWLRKKYQSQNILDFLSADKPALEALKSELEKLLKTGGLGQPRGFAISELVHELEGIINRLT